MKTTFEETFAFVDAAKAYIARIERSGNIPDVLQSLTPEQIECLEEYYGSKLVDQRQPVTEFIHALKKMAKRITTRTIPEFQNIIVNNQIDLCEADEGMEPKRDDKGNLV